MKHKITTFLSLICLMVIVSLGCGCLGNSNPEITDLPPGERGTYEINASLDNFTNSTMFYIFSNKTIRAVTTFTNSSRLEIIVPKGASAESGSEKDPLIREVVVLGVILDTNQSNSFEYHNFINISYNSSVLKSGNKRTVILEFDKLETGFVAYTFSWENEQFTHLLSRNETITVVLPPGYDTGNMILGSPKPVAPDEKFRDSKDRIRLVWTNPDPNMNYLSVKYYRAYLPNVLSAVGLVLSVCFVIAYIYFYNRIRTLQEKRKAIERDIRKKN